MGAIVSALFAAAIFVRHTTPWRESSVSWLILGCGIFGPVCQILWNTTDDPQVAKDPAAYLKEHGIGHTRGRPYHPMTQGKNQTLDIETKKERESTQCGVAANGSWNPREGERFKGPRRSDDIHRVLEVGTEYAYFFERSRCVS